MWVYMVFNYKYNLIKYTALHSRPRAPPPSAPSSPPPRAARELGGGGLAGACGGTLTCADAHALLGGELALIAPPPGARGAGAGSPPLRVAPEAAAVAPRAGSYVIKYAGGALLEPPPAARGGGGAPPGHHGGGGAWGAGLRQQYTAVLGHPQGFVRLGGALLLPCHPKSVTTLKMA
jgi:hypothetical protein